MNFKELTTKSVLELLQKTPAAPVVDWFLAEDWRTWLSHYLIVILVTLATGWWILLVSGIFTLLYLFREAIAAAIEKAWWGDHVMDWVSAWGGFGSGAFLLEGSWLGAIILTTFVAACGVVVELSKADEA